MVPVLFDATRLFMRASRGSPTGIDRVTEAYGRWLLTREDVELIPICSWGGLVSPMSVGRFKRILGRERRPAAAAGRDWARLVAALGGSDLGMALRAPPPSDPLARPGPRWAAYAARTLADWRPRRHGPDALYLNVSHFGLEQPGLLERLTKRGVRPVVMIHDLIPITHPEYCSASARGWHARRIEAVLGYASLVIANSASTAADLIAHARTRGGPVPPIRVVPLGLEPTFLDQPAALASARPYFVCVGTIEPRKNLAFLLTLWRRLAERLGEATPMLVLAGHRGWEAEAIIDHLERSPPVRRLVHEVGGLEDGQLARLIGGANALLAPSFSEGYDLPVAEAAALGTPVIASDIAAHRELAGHAQLLDPVDGPAWLAAIEAATVQRPRPRPVTPLGWPGHFAIVGEALGFPPVSPAA